MATSGSKDFALTRNDIINAALRKTGQYDKGEIPSGDETADASEALNILVKEFAGVYGADIFLRTELTLFIQSGQAQYSVGGTSTDHITESYVTTALTSGESTSDTSIVVDSATGISDGDYIGIKVDDGSIHWTTVNGAPVGTTVTITDGLDDDAAAGKAVYAYTTKASRPHDVSFVIRTDSNDLDNQIDIIGEGEYRALTDKSSTGVPTSIFYRASLGSGSLFVWPVGDGETDRLSLIAHYYPDDFDTAADNAQFPIEWSSALIWGLTAELSVEYGLPEREVKRNVQIATVKREAALDADIEGAPIRFARASCD